MLVVDGVGGVEGFCILSLWEGFCLGLGMLFGVTLVVWCLLEFVW